MGVSATIIKKNGEMTLGKLLHELRTAAERAGLEYRSIQIGLRREAVNKYVDEWVLKITDITDYVKKLKRIRDEGGDILNSLTKEREYKI